MRDPAFLTELPGDRGDDIDHVGARFRPAWLTVSTTGVLGGTPATADIGLNAFVVRATDGSGAYGEAALQITVAAPPPVNTTPVFATNPINLNATVDTAFVGQLAATDPDTGDTLTYTKISGPAWLTVSGMGALSGTPANAHIGSNAFVVRATDGSGAYGEAALEITVAPAPPANTAPAFATNPINLSATVGTVFVGQLAATDPDTGDTLTYTKDSGPAWLTVSGSGVLGGSPANAELGSNVFVVRVTDACGAFGEAALIVAVSPGDNDPVLDTDHDGLPDSWELAHGLDPNDDADATNLFPGSELTNLQAFNAGVQAHPNATPTNKDGDALDDDLDAVPTDAAIWWPKTPMPHYALVETGIPADFTATTAMPVDINRNGEILVKFDSGASRGVWKIWNPATGQARDVTPPLYGFFGTAGGDFIDDSSRIGMDGSHHTTLVCTTFTDQISMFLPPRGSNQPPVAGDWSLHFSGSRSSSPPLISTHVDTVDSWSLARSWDVLSGAEQYKTQHLDNGTWTDSQSCDLYYPDYPLSINSHGDVLFSDSVERSDSTSLTAEGASFNDAARLGSVIVPDPTPTDPARTRPVNVVICDSGMWVEKPDGQTLQAATHSTLPDVGRITENGTALTSSGIWINGGTFSLNDLVPPSGWINIQPFAMSTNGLIAATAESAATGNREIVMLEPIAVRAMTTLQWDGNTPYDPKGLAKGIDRMSGFASSGGGKTDEFWITAPIGGGSTVARFLTAANAPHTIGMDAAPHFSKTLAAPDEFTTITGSGTASVDVPVTFKVSGNKDAANHPVQLKVMKKRTVKVALHKVMGLDKDGNQTHPLFMPDPVNLTSYLNQVYGPQVNVNFEIVPFVEAGPGGTGIDFDLGTNGGDGALKLDDDQEKDAATLNAKAGLTGSDFNIDVWVVGGVSLKNPRKVEGFYDRLYGVALFKTSTVGRRIIVDGDVMAGFSEVPAGSQMHHLHFTIAHEIGHVMTGDGHPGETGYQSDLIWDGAPDPNLRRRLMTSGAYADHAHPEVCLIKKEWDEIEAWLNANIKDATP